MRAYLGKKGVIMYPIIQKENKEFRVIGVTSIPQNGCCDENEHNIIKAKKEHNKFDIEFLKLKPLKKIPKSFIMNGEKDYYYEEIKEVN